MFFRDFKIVPVFLKFESFCKEVQRLKAKRHDRLDKQRQIKFGLTFDEFLHLLLRISLRSQKKFKMFYEKFKKWETDDMGDRNKEKEAPEDAAEEEKPKEEEKKKLNQDDNKEWKEKEWNELQDWDKQEHVGD